MRTFPSIVKARSNQSLTEIGIPKGLLGFFLVPNGEPANFQFSRLSLGGRLLLSHPFDIEGRIDELNVVVVVVFFRDHRPIE